MAPPRARQPLLVIDRGQPVPLVLCLAVEQTEEGKLPDVEVTADGGQLPKYEVETAEVSVGTKTVEVEVPTATVEMPSDPDNKVTDETDSSKK